ncbi:MAG: DEAD/DEAH box helicase [Planctomycetaceae bacterium]
MTNVSTDQASSESDRPDTQAVLSELKDFQRDTVEHVFRRLYTDNDCTHRFLVADEVGLGKTLVARGVVAKAIDHLWDRTDRIDIVYVCSNSDIARQNIKRLKLKGCGGFSLASRITLLPIKVKGKVEVKDLEERKVNFVSFTPATSFDLKRSGGIAKERALLYWMLKDAWSLHSKTDPRPFEGTSRRKRFQLALNAIDPENDIHAGMMEAFIDRVNQDEALHSTFRALVDQMPPRRKVPPKLRTQCIQWIGRLRQILAETCLNWLQPDLIILDEFQRFKSLMNGRSVDASDAAKLAELLFTFQEDKDDSATAARVLLLSATPYKMLTTTVETEQEDHYSDFLLTLKFLIRSTQEQSTFSDVLRMYREELLHVAERGVDRLKDIRIKLEDMLRNVMVRTERLAVDPNRNGMLEIKPMFARPIATDIQQYLALQRIAGELNHGDMLEYWKSAPYLLNFMEDYDIKRKLNDAIPDQTDGSLAAAMKALGTGLLDRKAIEKYRRIDPANARLRALAQDTVDREAWRLLWIPPSLTYYTGSGAFAKDELSNFTKRLVFSNWKVVPKAIASVLSYEAERQMTRQYRKSAKNTPEARERRRGLLRFSVKDQQPGGMTALSLVYPSKTLATCFDPLELLSDSSATVETAIAGAERRISEKLQMIIERHRGTDHAFNERWYWAAPILLDLHYDPDAMEKWLKQDDLAGAWYGNVENTNNDSSPKGWGTHVALAQRLLNKGDVQLGEPPPDLCRVLAMMTLGAPGVVACRAFLRIIGSAAPQTSGSYDIRNDAGRLAHGFLSLFNSPEVTDLLRGNTKEEAYWRSVLEYCIGGNIQSMLDEYVHVLFESLNLKGTKPDKLFRHLINEIVPAVSLRNSWSQPDLFTTTARRVHSDTEFIRLRNHFAMRFGDQSRDDGDKEKTTAGKVRSAFNSPFWPFVLASTSVGQEGLDFHHYCHAVVHWNLPSNPVDLEQREGRVHRYKGHAVRKNIATAFATAVNADEIHADPWEAMFTEAQAVGSERHHNELFPFWISPEVPPGVNGQRLTARVERHVPMFPHSREVRQQMELQRTLVLYRMVFGQNRQDDLIAYLRNQLSEAEIDQLVDTCRIDLAPPAARAETAPNAL